MGAKQTKIEASSEPPPTLSRVSTYPLSNLQQPISISKDLDETLDNEMCGSDPQDPRSPNGCRTPMSILYTRPTQIQTQQQVIVEHLPSQSLDNPLSMLRKRFLKGFSLNDPRSPSLQLNRTPLIFDEHVDRTLNLDDTFADLFVESRAPSDLSSAESVVVSQQAEPITIDVEMQPLAAMFSESTAAEVFVFNAAPETVAETQITELSTSLTPNTTPLTLPEQKTDPRSPSIGVDRTPIIFHDDDNDEALEDAMLENILATLSLNLSSASSISSQATIATTDTAQQDADGDIEVKPANKHLERVRQNGGRARKPQRNAQRRRPQKKTMQPQQQIYEDCENAAASTPKKRCNSQIGSQDSANKRTPLSCVKNREHHMRSRSVESSSGGGGKVAARLAHSSQDDQVLQSTKRTQLRIVQDFEAALLL